MNRPFAVASLLRWITTLKFKIVSMAVVTGVLSAMGTAHFVLTSLQGDIQQLLLQASGDEAERSAALLSTKLEMMQNALTAVAREVRAPLWQDREAMQRFLMDKPALGTLFDNVLAVRPDGTALAGLVGGSPVDPLPSLADRAYFQQALSSAQPIISPPLIGRVGNTPSVVLAVPVSGPGGAVSGVLAASIRLQSTKLFSEVAAVNRRGISRTLVMSRSGVVLAHPQPDRVMGRAADEPALAGVLAPWSPTTRPLDPHGQARIVNAHLVSMAGIPAVDWVLVHLTPQASAQQPMIAARLNAWKAAAAVGLLVAVLAGVLAWQLTRPISKLRTRAEQMLSEVALSTEGWPNERGEIGELAQAFQQVVQQRQREQGETQALLHQLEAVLDHAEIGIVLSRSGNLELVSRHFCHIFRCEKHHAVGQPARMIYASDEAYQALSARARPAFMEQGFFDGEVELMRRSGQLFWAHLRGRAVVSGDQSQGTIWTIEDVTEMRAHRERLTWTSSHDSLTGLANRAAFEALLEHATARAAAEPFCALFIDLDHFKPVNDTGGHAAGDALLRDIAHALATQVRQTDTVARLGGDEFAVLLSRCPLTQAIEIAEKLRSAVISYQLLWEGRTFSVGASIGLVAVNASYGSAADVLRAADTACYAAKQKGRNCVAVHDQPGVPTPATPKHQPLTPAHPTPA